MRTILPLNPRLVPEQASRVFEGVIYNVYHWDQPLFNGTTEVFEMLKRPDTVVTIAIKDHKLVVVHEEQPHFVQPMYGLPMGRHDVESETELEAAQRELREETGLIFDTWRLIDITQPDRKVESFVYVFLAIDLVEEVDQLLDGGERITVKLMDRDEAVAAAKSDASRYLPTSMLEGLRSIDELAKLPQYGLES